MDATPADLPLPDFLDPLLAYLSDTLPAPIYSFLTSLLSHLLALATALYALLRSLLSTHPLQWDAQTVLPPLIALLTSYLAIVSIYRTTSWMFRTSLFFIKWGSIFGALVAGVSWLLAQQDGNAIGGRGMVAGLGGLLLNMLNGEGRNAAGGSRRTRSQTSKSKSKSSRTRAKPKAWESWDRHREWQYQENEERAADGPGVQEMFAGIMDAAGKVAQQSGWWEAAKGAFFKDDRADTRDTQATKPEGKGKSRSR